LFKKVFGLDPVSIASAANMNMPMNTKRRGGIDILKQAQDEISNREVFRLLSEYN